MSRLIGGPGHSRRSWSKYLSCVDFPLTSSRGFHGRAAFRSATVAWRRRALASAESGRSSSGSGNVKTATDKLGKLDDAIGLEALGSLKRLRVATCALELLKSQ